MTAQPRCHCQSCVIRGLTGPAILITIGVLFLLSQIHGGHFDFGSTWPVILVVLGLIQLASSLAPRDGHLDLPGAPLPPQSTIPPGNPPQAPFSGQGQ